MPTPQEVKPGAPGFGARRFLIRGRIFAPEEQTRLLKDLIDEIPERWAINPDFPRPGRRSGSRPRPQPPIAPGTPAPTPPGGETPTVFGRLTPGQPGDTSYPLPRDRETNQEFITAAVSPLIDPTQGGACLSRDGQTFPFNNQVPAGLNVATVSARINRPFVITHVQHLNTGLTNLANFMTLLVSTDNDVSDPDNLTGTQVFDPNIGNSVAVRAINNVIHFYPSFVQRSTPSFIKVFHAGGAGGISEMETIVDVIFLD